MSLLGCIVEFSGINNVLLDIKSGVDLDSYSKGLFSYILL